MNLIFCKSFVVKFIFAFIKNIINFEEKLLLKDIAKSTFPIDFAKTIKFLYLFPLFLYHQLLFFQYLDN